MNRADHLTAGCFGCDILRGHSTLRNTAWLGTTGKTGDSMRADLFFMPLLQKIIAAKFFAVNKPNDFRRYIKSLFAKMFPLSQLSSQCSDDGTITNVMDKVG